jgi:hypothetical protein
MRYRSTVGMLFGWAVALLLAGCAGGGGGSSELTISPTSPPPPTGATGVAYPAFTFVAPTGGVGPFTWTESGALPQGMALSADGHLSGTPTTAGTFTFTLTVKDSSAPVLTAQESVTLVVADSPLTINLSPPPPAGTASQPYPAFAFSAAGGSQPFSWSVTAGSLPPGLTLDTGGSLIGTPDMPGSYTFTVTAAESAQNPQKKSAAFTIVVTDATVVINPGQTPPAGVHGTPYNITFTATGGTFPYTWAVTAGTLPPGLTLNPDGTLNGTPTVPSATPFAFTVTVTDSSTPTAETNSVPYVITISDPPPPSINNTPPTTATVGLPYSFQFTASGGLAPLIWSSPTAPTGGLALGVDGILSGTPSTAGIFPITLTVKDAMNRSSPAASFMVRVATVRPAAAFTLAGSMVFARTAHTATLLLDGRVLIADGGVATAEVYEPTSQTFTATGNMTLNQSTRSATLLNNSTLPNYGKVLMAGGGDSSAELFDPAAGVFTATGSTVAAHLGQTATLLRNGHVLIAGGETVSADLFNPSTGTFTATGSMTVSRTAHTATLLADGRVLIAGGVQNFGPGTVPIPLGPGVASAELYDPVSGTFAPTGSMSEGRSGHTATLLADGTVLITGTDNTAELFNPGSGTFSLVGELSAPRCSQATATLRNDDTVLIAGGRQCYGRPPKSLATAELFAPESGGFVTTGSLITARDGHTATLLADGAVLITGGTSHQRACAPGGPCIGSDTVLSSAELFK